MNKRIIVMMTFLSCLFLTVQAQQVTVQDVATKLGSAAPADTTQGWKLSGISGVDFGQTTLTNWSAGGGNSVSGRVYLNGSLRYTKNKWSWNNLLALQYGSIFSSETNWRKSADNISFTSIGGYQINSKWSYALLLDFNSQFARGYDYTTNPDVYISTFMAPAYSNLALGVTYKPNDKYMLFLSPITARMTFVMNDSLSNIPDFGVDKGKKFKMEPGAYVVATTKQSLAQNVEIISKLDMFTPYNDRFGNIDMNWDVLINFKINKLLTANLSTTVRYYENEIKRVQFKEIFGLGFAYSFK